MEALKNARKLWTWDLVHWFVKTIKNMLTFSIDNHIIEIYD